MTLHHRLPVVFQRVAIAVAAVALACLAAAGTVAANPASHVPDAPSASPTVDLLTVDGAIDPMNAQYVARGLRQAASDHAEAVLIVMNTPGGLDSAMRQITGAMLTTPVPVIVYVTPAGARAGSAGVFILMAADVAAMAPGTNVGAAHPVGLGTSGSSNLPDDERTKATNDAAAYMRQLATSRHHNATWAEEAVRQSVALTADEALSQHVIDRISADNATLLRDVDGTRITRQNQTLTLRTRDAQLRPIEMTLSEQLLHLIDDPNISYLLLTLGAYALLAELFHPGSILPGVVGVLGIALALTAFESLPMNWTGVGLILIAIVLFVLDVKAPTHGALTAAGVATFVVGSLMLFSPVSLPELDSGQFGLAVSPLLVALIAVALTGFFVFVVRAGLRARQRPAMAIGAADVGALGVAVTDLTPVGSVRVHGADWNADAAGETIHSGESVEVLGRKGLRLIVKRINHKGA